MRRLAFVAPVIIFVILALLLLAALLVRRSQEEAGISPTELPSPLIGQQAPDFALPPLDEKTLGLLRADLASGQPVILNFWASWCTPCRAEHPILEDLSQRKDLALYGVDYKDTPQKARALLDELGNPFARLAIDQPGRVAIDWGVTGVPETFVIDGKGVVKAHVAGPLTPEIVQSIILPAAGLK